MGEENHARNAVYNDHVQLGCSIVYKLFYFLHSVFSGSCLLCGNGSKRWENCGTNGSGVVEKCACYLLNEFIFSW